MSVGSENRLARWQVLAADRTPSKANGSDLLGSTFYVSYQVFACC